MNKRRSGGAASGGRRWVVYFSAVVFAVALVAGGMELLAGLGVRWGWWHYRVGFGMLRWAFYGGAAAAVLALVGCGVALWLGPRRALAAVLPALLVGLVTAFFPLTLLRTARSVPPIHDISTDTENPPALVALLPLRAGAANPAEYGGPEVAAKQKAGYPELAPRDFAMPPGELFPLALRTAEGMGWRIVAAREPEGRIEAVATTSWFGFQDDVVIRIAARPGGSRLDVRSVSRVGRSDLGTNARRVRAYLERLPAGG